MCGIAGMVGSAPLGEEQRIVLRKMRDTMSHRGPDDLGEWWSEDGRVGLAHRRLAIVDLSPRGKQPMSDSQGKYWITFNGEIYNFEELRQELESRGHSFVSRTDTEVILEAYSAWGPNCLERLDGMFAFALFDKAERKILFARDRAGEKPLYYRVSAGCLAFASELKALMADTKCPRVLDSRAFEDFLAFGYVAQERCILQGVKKLPQGHAAIFELDRGQLEVWEYWRLPRLEADPRASDDDLEAQLEELLERSVKRQLVADVPVGILLSGGIDSSLVTAIAARRKGGIRTFTVSFPGHGTLDESGYARAVAQSFATKHTDLVAEPASVDLLPQLAAQFDEPLGDSSMVPTYLVSKQIREHATVALGGDGGDELFGGYGHYRWLLEQQRFAGLVPAALRSAFGNAVRTLLPVGWPGRNYAMAFGEQFPGTLAYVNLFFDANGRARLVSRDLSAERFRPERFKRGLCNKLSSLVQEATRLDFQTYLPDDILVKVDRASMLTSLEVRAPWLDRRVVEFAFGKVPDRLKATHGGCKILPRRLAARLLPSSIHGRRKQGFAIPFASWFRQEWGTFIESVLREADPQLWNSKALESLIRGQKKGCGNHQRLFALTMFELWRRHYKISLG